MRCSKAEAEKRFRAQELEFLTKIPDFDVRISFRPCPRYLCAVTLIIIENEREKHGKGL